MVVSADERTNERARVCPEGELVCPLSVRRQRVVSCNREQFASFFFVARLDFRVLLFGVIISEVDYHTHRGGFFRPSPLEFYFQAK